MIFLSYKMIVMTLKVAPYICLIISILMLPNDIHYCSIRQLSYTTHHSAIYCNKRFYMTYYNALYGNKVSHMTHQIALYIFVDISEIWSYTTKTIALFLYALYSIYYCHAFLKILIQFSPYSICNDPIFC